MLPQVMFSQVGPPSHAISLEQILMTLRLSDAGSGMSAFDQVIDRINAERDLIFYLSTRISPSRRSWIPAMLRNPIFDHWFQSPRSSTLVVTGMDLGVTPDEPASPWSYVCAMLAKSASTMPNFAPIAFFCRLHMDPDDQLTGAAGLIRSLTAQLALQVNEAQSTSFVGLDPATLQGAAVNDLFWLCKVFDQILENQARRGPKVVFCMIDGVSFFETDYHLPGTNHVMQFLRSVVDAVNASQSGLVFKLLITSPRMSEHCARWFPNRVDLTVSGNMTAGSRELGDTTMLFSYQGMLGPSMGGGREEGLDTPRQ